jgi:fumarate reductase flavoprotein subunit
VPDIDVLVAGAGAGGLAAAVAAAQRGAAVVVAEATETFRVDSNTAMSTSMVPAGGSRWQEAAGIEDSPDGFLADIRRKTRDRAHPVVARALVDVAPGLVAWLADDVGVPLELVTDFNYPGHSVHRCHAVADRSGRTLHRHLLAAAEASGITLMVPMRLDDLQVDQSGAVSGVILENPDGARETVTTGAVVLATNGFGANAEMVSKHIPEMNEALYFGGHGSRGDAMLLAERYGLDLADMDAYQGHGSVATPHGVLTTWATVMHGAVIMDRHGRRFADETIGYSEFARLVLDRDGGEAWLVLDGAIDQACRVFADYADLIEAGAVRWVETSADLAGRIGADPSVVHDTLAQAASSAEGSADDPLGRRDWEAALKPPYGVVRITGALFHTQGGLDVDASARVLRSGKPVPGLYAAGGAAVGMSGRGADGYLAGNGLLAALGLGFLAGQATTQESREES